MIALALLAMHASLAQQEILVRGRRTGEALNACLARGCSTQDDVRLSIAHAETQFAEGQYRDARQTLLQALSRQKANSALCPRHIAALHEANATVNLHLGDREAYRGAVRSQADTLRNNLPPDSADVLLMAVRLGDLALKEQDYAGARSLFEQAAEGYARAGQQRLQALSLLRVVAVDVARANHSSARRRLAEVGTLPVATDPAVRSTILVMQARIAAAAGDDEGVERLLAGLKELPGALPVLIEPGKRGELRPDDTSGYLGADAATSRFASAGVGTRRWADVGFMIGPDGRVNEVEVLRGSRDPRRWLGPYLREIATRRYAPPALSPDQPGLYRVERYTLRSEFTVPKGSLVRRPSGHESVEVLDMTKAGPVPTSR